jgi:phosphoglycolate phosphatase
MIRHLIFDLDGTLIDSKNDIISSIKVSFDSIGRNIIDRVEETYIGLPLREIAFSIDPSMTDEEYKLFQNIFRKDYDEKSYSATFLMDGVTSVIAKLLNMHVTLYIATAKPTIPTKKILSALKISQYFKSVISMDSLAPDNRTKEILIQKILKENAISYNEAAYVGDYPTDIIAASKCGIKAIAFLNGYGKREDLLALNPDYSIERLEDLLNLF